MSKASLFFVGIGAALLPASDAWPLSAGETAPMAEVASAPELTDINYKHIFRRMMQLGMVSQVLGFNLVVDVDGKAIDCQLSRSFRSLYTTRQICKELMRFTIFEPARDAQGNAVVGTYEGEMEIASFFQPSR